MKKKITILILLQLSLFCLAKENRSLILSNPIEYKKLSFSNQKADRKSFISYDEMIQDLDALIYYLQTAYIGYNSIKAKGFSENDLKKYFNEVYNGKNQILVHDFYKKNSDYLRTYTEDMHFTIEEESGVKFDTLFRGTKLYFSNIYVEYKNGCFSVVKTGEKDVKIDSIYTGDEENLFYYPSKGENIYRLGVFNKNFISNCDFFFDDKKVNVSVAPEKQFLNSTLIKYHEIVSDKSAYASLSSFVLPETNSIYRKGAEIVFEKFSNFGIKYRNKKNIIIDLRSNLGGRAYFANGFIYSFFVNGRKIDLKRDEKRIDRWFDKNFVDRIELESPAYLQSVISYLDSTGEQNKYYYRVYNKSLKEQKANPQLKIYKNLNDNVSDLKNRFDGKLLIIVDNQTGSASEDFVFKAKKILGIDNVVVIGENTAGCYTYMDICNYLLPNSRISIRLGAMKNIAITEFSAWHGEGVGFYPDYWSTGEDLNETIFLVTQDEEMKQKLNGIELGLK